MNPQITTPPATYPVSLAEAKAQLQIETSDYDARIAGLIAAATTAVETFIGQALITRSYRGFLNWWPNSDRGWITNHIKLFPGPLQSVTDLITYDDTDTPTTFPTSQYYVDTAQTVGRIVLRRGCVWPIPLRVANGVQIDWVAGMGATPQQIPEPIRLAIQMMVGLFNEVRGDEGPDPKAPAIPAAAYWLLQPYFVTPPT